MEKRLPGTGRRWGYSGLHRDEGCQLGDQHQTDDGDARASHELLHALALGTGVIVAVAFQQIDAASRADAAAQSNHQRTQNIDCRIEKCHISVPPKFLKRF